MSIFWTICSVILLIAYFGYRWKQASDYSEAMSRELELTRAWHLALMNHPAWAHLHGFLVSRGVHVVAGRPEPGQYQLKLLSLCDALAQKMAPDDPRAAWLNAYCEGPKKIVASLMLQSGQASVRDASWGDWPGDADRV
jgi:hypothetical protein